MERPGPAAKIETQRLVLRPLEVEEAPQLKRAIDESLDHLLPWMAWAAAEPEPVESKVDRIRRHQRRFESREALAYGVFETSAQALIGNAVLEPRAGEGDVELGYWLHVDYVGRGLAREAAAGLTRVGFEVEGHNCLEIRCDPENRASAAIPRHLGYRHVDTLVDDLERPGGGLRDTQVWLLDAEEYPASTAASQSVRAFDREGRRVL